MRLSFVFLFIAATLLACNGLLLVSGESKRTEAVEFHSAQRHSRSNSTDRGESEERVQIKTLSKEDLKPTLLRLPETFPLPSIIEKMNKNKLRGVRDMVFDPNFVDDLRRSVSIQFGQYLAISLYLMLWKSYRFSMSETAKHINQRLKTAMGPEEVDIATLIEDGQFLLWRQVVKAEGKDVKRILLRLSETKWKREVFKRYQQFWQRSANNQIPGLRETSKPRATSANNPIPGLRKTSKPRANNQIPALRETLKPSA